MTTRTRKAKRGRTICQCEGDLETCEKLTIYEPRDGGEKIPYTIEFQICIECGQEYVITTSILKNEGRLKQAKLEATVAYKMKQWLQNKQE